MSPIRDDLDRIYRAEYGQVVATLASVFGDLDVAEDAAQEAFTVAASRWPTTGVPANPGGWLTTTARRRAIDRLRREARREDRHAEAALLHARSAPPEIDPVHDDRLKLLFTCCHPALAVEAQVALTLRTLGGLRTAEIARAFLVSESAMEQRLVRVKRKIRTARIPYRVPADHELPERLAVVLAVLYLVFNEGYVATAGDHLVRQELCEEAIRLARLLSELMPDEPEAQGLLALLLLTHARRDARTDAAGDLVVLAEQDRSRWDHELLAEGHRLVRACLRRDRPGPYQLHAAIAAVHTDASTAEATDWRQILALYDRWLAVAPTPLVAMNRVVALAEVHGPETALEALDALWSEVDLAGYHLAHATRAELLHRLGRRTEAVRAFERARERTTNLAERRHLDRRLAAARDGHPRARPRPGCPPAS